MTLRTRTKDGTAPCKGGKNKGRAEVRGRRIRGKTPKYEWVKTGRPSPTKELGQRPRGECNAVPCL